MGRVAARAAGRDPSSIHPDEAGEGPRLDDIGNRVWVALLATPQSIDLVLEEFGLTPSETPDLGGGNFGLAPKTARELDPTGTLVLLWDRYRVAYLRYLALAG